MAKGSNLFASLGSWFSKASGKIQVPNVLQRLWTRAPTRDKSEYPDLFHKNPRLNPVRVKADIVATTPWKIYRKGDVRVNGYAAVPLPEHELYDLLDRPMPMYPEIDGVALLKMTSVCVDLVGEYFWLKIRSDTAPNGPPIQLYAIPPAWVAMTPTLSQPYFLVYPFGVTAGNAFPVPAEDMIWFKDVDMTDPYSRGRGMAEGIVDEATADELAGKMQKNYMYNSGVPEGILFAPNVSEAQAQAVKDGWRQKISGYINNRAGPAILNWKDANYQAIGLSPKEVDMVESRKFWRDEANSFFRTPPEIVGVVENSNRSTIDASRYLFGLNVLRPCLYFFERVLDRQLIAADFDNRLVLRFDNVVLEDETTKYTRISEGLAKGVVMVDEFRAFLKLPPDPKGGQVYLRPFNVVQVPFNSEPVESAPVVPDPGDRDGVPNKPPVQTDDQNDTDEVDGTIPAKAIIRIVEKATIPALRIVSAKDLRRKAIWTAFDKTATAGEPAFIAAVKKFAGNQRARFQKAFNDAIETGTTPEGAVEAGYASAFGSASDKAMKAGFAGPWLASMGNGRDHALSILGSMKGKKDALPEVGGTFEVTNDRFNEWVDTVGLAKAKGMNDTTLSELKKQTQAAISQGISDGSTNADIAKAILAASDGVYDEMTTTRAKTIARTETATSVNFGQVQTYKAEGVKSKEWLAVQDDRTRDDHAEADGQVVGIDEEFDVGGDSIDSPGSGSDPAENINCRCTILPVVE